MVSPLLLLPTINNYESLDEFDHEKGIGFYGDISARVFPAFQVPVLEYRLNHRGCQYRAVDFKNPLLFSLFQNIDKESFRIKFTGNRFFMFFFSEMPCFHVGKEKPRLHYFTEIQMGPDGRIQLFSRMMRFANVMRQYLESNPPSLILNNF